MKKILFALTLLFATAAAFAQTTMTASSATNTNAVTQTHTTSLRGAATNYDVITIQAVGTKVSGTPAGTVIIYGSLDGTNYVAIGADTMTITNTASQTHVWTFDKTRYAYYQAAVATTGTQVSTWALYLLGRKNPN